MLYTVELYFENGTVMTLVMNESGIKRLARWWKKRHDDPRMLFKDVDSDELSDGYGLETKNLMAYRVIAE